ncbi:MAG: aminotransferase class I/II-fold pyridoxal phosphate-dependent enzyme [Woeseiaceae bacterium]|nr:aminotransferase class I/II-fold pyridoxal phosphate-dependent enzyme [Woeseiaceae bacterium]
MTNLTRRQVLLGGTAIAAASMITGIPKTPLTPRMKFMRDSIAADIPRPDYMVRLGANENPYGPSRVALKAIHENMHLVNRYADDPGPLMDTLAELNGVSADNIVVGTGSSEILATVGMLTGMRGGSVVCADPTYQSLLLYAENAGVEIIRVPVDEGLKADLDGMRRALRDDTSLVYLVNPNNPIPNIIEGRSMREFVLEMAEDHIVFVDEAYHEYVEDPSYESMIPLIAEGHKNIIVSRTASKIHGLAGMRVGFGFAHPDIIQEMRWRKTGRNAVLGLEAAHASYLDDEFPKFSLRKNRESRAIVEKMCDELGLRYVKSNTNFTFIRTGIDNDTVQATMEEYGILTGRNFPPLNNEWSRISMSKPEEMEYFVQVYKQLFT